jgi:hypothetical protein
MEDGGDAPDKDRNSVIDVQNGDVIVQDADFERGRDMEEEYRDVVAEDADFEGERDMEDENENLGVEDADFEKEEMDEDEEEQERDGCVPSRFGEPEEYNFGELDADDKFLELGTDYEEDDLDDVELEQEHEEDDTEQLWPDYAGSSYAEEKESSPVQSVAGLAGNGCSVSDGDGSGTSEVCETLADAGVDADLDAVDPISKRTRSRKSLADQRLDYLESLLQESDDEEDEKIQESRILAEKEEYRKFLIAIDKDLRANRKEDEEAKEDEGRKEREQSGEEPEQTSRKEEDDDEEEDDMDFDVEIEEALGSDETTESVRRGRIETRKRRIETREKKWRRAQLHPIGPLRHILPHVPNSSGNDFPMFGNRQPSAQGFTAKQLGQLYSQMHEHVQLLIQLHSLTACVPAQEHIAKKTRGLLEVLVKKRELVLSEKQSAFPDICFRPPYTCTSQPKEGETQVRLLRKLSAPQASTPPDTTTYTSSSPGQSGRISSNMTFANGLGSNGCRSLSGLPTEQAKPIWSPVVRLPIRTLFDVASLALVPNYLASILQGNILQSNFHPDCM